MQYRILGNTGVKVSVIGLGANNFGGRNDEPSSFRSSTRPSTLASTS